MRQFLFVTFLLGLMSLPAVYFLGEVTAYVAPSRPVATAAVPKVAVEKDAGKDDDARDPATVVEDAVGVLHRVALGLAESFADTEAPGTPLHGLAMPAGNLMREAGTESDVGLLPNISGGSGTAQRPGRISVAGTRTGGRHSVVLPPATADDLEAAGAPHRSSAPGLGVQRSSDPPGPQRAWTDFTTAYSGHLGLRRVHPTSITWFDLV